MRHARDTAMTAPARAIGAAVLLALLGARPAPAAPPTGGSIAIHVDEARVPAYTIPADHPAIGAGRAALQSVYRDQAVLLAVIAGSLPAATLFERALGAKTLFFSFSTADEKLHAPDEFLRVRRLKEGMRAWAELLRLLATGPHRLAPLSPPPAAPGS